MSGTTDLAMSFIGTPSSMSPEVCENKPYGFKADIWGLGCVLYEMCTAKQPFDAHNILGIVWKIVHEDIPPLPDTFSHEMKALISMMLNKDASRRYEKTYFTL
jgi:serine/threonine protein kinase